MVSLPVFTALVGGGGISGVHGLPVAGRPGAASVGGSRNAGARKSKQSSRFGVRVAAGQRAEVELRLDEPQHRRVVVHDVRHVVALARTARSRTRARGGRSWFHAAGAPGAGATPGGMSSGGTAAGGGTWS